MTDNPFACYFYIPSLDLFIECNYRWTHGGKPYEGTEDDKQIVYRNGKLRILNFIITLYKHVLIEI